MESMCCSVIIIFLLAIALLSKKQILTRCKYTETAFNLNRLHFSNQLYYLRLLSKCFLIISRGDAVFTEEEPYSVMATLDIVTEQCSCPAFKKNGIKHA